MIKRSGPETFYVAKNMRRTDLYTVIIYRYDNITVVACTQACSCVLSSGSNGVKISKSERQVQEFSICIILNFEKFLKMFQEDG